MPSALIAQEADRPPPPTTEGAAPLAATQTLDPAPNADPTARFTASPNPLPAGGLVAFDASGSTDPDGAIASYRWDLDGDGTFEADTGAEPKAVATYPLPGTVTVRLRVTDDRGAEAESVLDVTAQPLPEPQPAAAPPAVAPAPAPAPPRTAPRAVKAATPTKQPAAAPPISAAASTSVTISDFKFAPRRISVKVGDTVSWTNRGDQPHTATANDGSFDTGTLSKGRSGSYTFTKAGTFTYICTPHPFMKGTVTVTGASDEGSSSGGGSAGPDDASAAGDDEAAGAANSGGGSLPNTGLAIASLLFTGAGLITAGATLRLALARRYAGA